MTDFTFYPDALFHLRILINSLIAGMLFGIIIYRNVLLKYDTKRRWW